MLSCILYSYSCRHREVITKISAFQPHFSFFILEIMKPSSADQRITIPNITVLLLLPHTHLHFTCAIGIATSTTICHRVVNEKTKRYSARSVSIIEANWILGASGEKRCLGMPLRSIKIFSKFQDLQYMHTSTHTNT